MLNPDDFDAAQGARLCNVISLLLPARSYTINCAWTHEVPLPAIEEFTCRLLLLLEQVLPGDIKAYFGLSERECEILIDSLIISRLAIYTTDGHITPSPMLQTKTNGNLDALPSLTKFEEKLESPIFDLLTLTIMTPRKYNRTRFGLPELPIATDLKNIDNQDIIAAFGDQYRAYLEGARKKDLEIRRTRLYKISSCEQGSIVQAPIDLEIYLKIMSNGQVKVIKDTTEKASDLNTRPLTIQMEEKISDFLNDLELPTNGLSLEEFCHAVNDNVLLRYVKGSTLNFNSWLTDHKDRKTGYGSQLTRSMIGPVYLNNNRQTLEQFIRDQSRSWAESESHNALWLSSSVPLWGANGMLLGEFIQKIESELCESREGKGNITAIFPCQDSQERSEIKRQFVARIPNAITFPGDDLQDRVDIFLIPGQVAVVQYHCQPTQESAITVPIGYITRDPERLTHIHSLLQLRLEHRPSPQLAWSRGNLSLPDLIDLEAFSDTNYVQSSATKPGAPTITYKSKLRRS